MRSNIRWVLVVAASAAALVLGVIAPATAAPTSSSLIPDYKPQPCCSCVDCGDPHNR